MILSPSHRTTRLVVLGLAVTACLSSHETPPELLTCPQTPYVGARSLWRSDAPPNGRIWACEACAMHEEEVLARAVVLGCPFTGAHDACVLTGACDYPETVAGLALVRSARTCDELAALAGADLSVRPDPDVYWRPEGD